MSKPRRDLAMPRLRIGAAIAIAAAAGFAVWLVLRNEGSSSFSPTTQPGGTTTTRATKPVVGATVANLRKYAAAAGHPVYWIGPKNGYTYELTRTSDGRIYIRYLPPGVRVGDTRANFTIVGTYPVTNALLAIKTAAKESGGVTLRLPGGRLGVYNRRSPTNVYFADKNSNYQVEVYDPNAARARRLVVKGTVRPIH